MDISAKILIIDDDENLVELLRIALKQRGFAVFAARDGEEGLAMFHQVASDLVILDVMMPHVNGWDVCRRMRSISSVPILFLTALDSVENKVHGLLEGGDDYLVKPFQGQELCARVGALLRRAQMPPMPSSVLRLGDGMLVINIAEQKVFVDEREVSLSPIEYNLLVFMAKRAGRILSLQQIYDAVWGNFAEADPEGVRWYIWSLRRKIERDPQSPQFILTERGKGYRFSLRSSRPTL